MEDFVLSCLESRVENNRSLYARFLLGPFQNGHALTVASALRRALLSEIESVAILALDIQGITHEFSTIAGVRESVLELSLNFQEIVLRRQTEWISGNSQSCLRIPATQIGYLQIQGPAIVYANDLELPVGVECVDPTQHIATLSSDGILIAKFLIGKGSQSHSLKRNNSMVTLNQIKRGKKALQDQSTFASKSISVIPFNSDICLQNIIPLEPFSTPVTRVNFVVETDHLSNKKRERVIFELWTNGSIHPRQAIHQGVLALLRMFSAFRRMHHLDSHSLPIIQSGGITDSVIDTLRHPKLSETRREQAIKRLASLQRDDRGLLTNPAANISPRREYKDVQKRFLSLYKSSLDKVSFLASDISNLPLALKTYMCLKHKNIHKLHDILNYSPKTLLKLVNGNKRMFYDIKRCVMQLGLQLKD